MGLRNKLLLGDKLESFIKAVLPKDLFDSNCGCEERKDWMNGETRQEALARLEAAARLEKYGS